MKDVRTSEYYKRIKAVLNENEFKKAEKKFSIQDMKIWKHFGI